MSHIRTETHKFGRSEVSKNRDVAERSAAYVGADDIQIQKKSKLKQASFSAGEACVHTLTAQTPDLSGGGIPYSLNCEDFNFDEPSAWTWTLTTAKAITIKAN